jgi:hypothetical protein
MRRTCVQRLAVLVTAATAIAAPSAADDPTIIRPTAPIQLFNGRDLSGFETWLVDQHGEDPARVFSVVEEIDGGPALRISGERWGGIATRDRYADYRLVVEFRWGLLTWGDRKTAARDSGVLVHGNGRLGNTRPDMNGPWMRSIEAQIIEGGVGDIILVGGYEPSGVEVTPTIAARVVKDRDGEDAYSPNGELHTFTKGRINWFGRDPDWTDRLAFRGKHDVESQAGEWTRLEVTCRAAEIAIRVNGVLVNAATDAGSAGRIMLQSEGAEIYFRRVELLPIDSGK